jgi:hypothetical protein
MDTDANMIHSFTVSDGITEMEMLVKLNKKFWVRYYFSNRKNGMDLSPGLLDSQQNNYFFFGLHPFCT